MNTPEAAWARVRGTLNLTIVAERLSPPRTPAAVSAWKKVPAELVVQVSRITGIPRETLRPDLYELDPWSQLQ